MKFSVLNCFLVGFTILLVTQQRAFSLHAMIDAEPRENEPTKSITDEVSKSKAMASSKSIHDDVHHVNGDDQAPGETLQKGVGSLTAGNRKLATAEENFAEAAKADTDSESGIPVWVHTELQKTTTVMVLPKKQIVDVNLNRMLEDTEREVPNLVFESIAEKLKELNAYIPTTALRQLIVTELNVNIIHLSMVHQFHIRGIPEIAAPKVAYYVESEFSDIVLHAEVDSILSLFQRPVVNLSTIDS